MSGPIIVCLCGSTKFKDAYEEAMKQETLAGRIVLAPGIYFHADEVEVSLRVKDFLDHLHLRKIDLADEVLVVDCEGYIGHSTRKGIAYAIVKEKPVRYWSIEHKGTLENERMGKTGC